MPVGLATSAVTETSLNISWTASSDNVAVTGYDVYLNGSLYSSPTSASASITGLSPYTDYALTVRAKDAAGNNSAQSSALNITTLDTHAPSLPSGLATSAVTETSLTLTWTASSDNVAVTG